MITDREDTALKLLLSTSLSQLVQGILVLRTRKDAGRINPLELLQLQIMENDLEVIMADIGQNADPNFSLVGRA